MKVRQTKSRIFLNCTPLELDIIQNALEDFSGSWYLSQEPYFALVYMGIIDKLHSVEP